MKISNMALSTQCFTVNCVVKLSKTLATGLATTAVSATLFGCASKDVEPQAVEVPSATLATIDAPQEQLFNTARQLYRSRLYSVAKDSFSSLKNGFPLGPYAAYADIKVADCEFNLGEYAVAAGLYENFTKEHPSSAAAPYMLGQAARSYFLASRGAGRDISPLEKSLAAYELLIERYPDSPYGLSAPSEKKKVRTQLAAHDRLVIDFYKNQERPKAYAKREEEFRNKWAGLYDSSGAIQFGGAAPQLVAVNRTSLDLTQTAVAPLRPKMIRANRARHRGILTGRIERDAMRAGLKSPELSSIESQRTLKNSGISESAPRLSDHTYVRNISCPKNSNNAVFIHLNENSRTKLALPEMTVPPVNENIVIKVVGLAARNNIVKSCFQTDDLSVSKNGEIRFHSETPVSVFQISHPARIVLLRK